MYIRVEGQSTFSSVSARVTVLAVRAQGLCLLCAAFGLTLCSLTQNATEEAMDMYQELHMWDECIMVAEAKVQDIQNTACTRLWAGLAWQVVWLGVCSRPGFSLPALSGPHLYSKGLQAEDISLC